jgi:4-diphosphocytidyl-2-C-methyl-D-erythritol kinase
VTRWARVVAQAKVNLRLRILAREASGYHSLETVFLRLDLGDEVVVREAAGRTLDCSGPAMPAGGLGPVEKNLAMRAANAYAEATGWPNGFAIEIRKHIPVGGGLGGGSADAGAVLRALDALSPNPLGPRLIELAGPLGADVPFMTVDSPMALAWSRGERLFPVAPPQSRPVLLMVPPFGVPTPDAYGWLSSARGTYVPTPALISPDALATWESIAAVAANDFEPVVAARHPMIARLVDGLASAGAVVAMLSGSGSTVFGVFASGAATAPVPHPDGVTKIATRTSTRVERIEVNQ